MVISDNFWSVTNHFFVDCQCFLSNLEKLMCMTHDVPHDDIAAHRASNPRPFSYESYILTNCAITAPLFSPEKLEEMEYLSFIAFCFTGVWLKLTWWQIDSAIITKKITNLHQKMKCLA